MRSYGRALGVLGDVSRRSDHHAAVPLADDEEVARPHVRANDTDHLKPAAATRAADVPAPRVRLQPPILPGADRTAGAQRSAGADRVNDVPAPRVHLQSPIPPGAGRTAGADKPAALVPPLGVDRPLDDLTMLVPVVEVGPPAPGVMPVVAPPSEPDRPMLFDDALEETEPPRRPRREMRTLAPGPGRENLARRAATGAAAAVVAGALAVGGYELASSRSPSSPSQGSASAASSTVAPRGGGTAPQHRAHASTTTTTLPAAATHAHHGGGLQPTSVSSTVVSYTVPSSSYTVTVTASAAGACWVGVQPSASASSYLWMDTVAPGASASYKATGTVAVRVGNPSVLSLQVNGQKVNLPAGRSQVYDVVLSPSQGSA